MQFLARLASLKEDRNRSRTAYDEYIEQLASFEREASVYFLLLQFLIYEEKQHPISLFYDGFLYQNFQKVFREVDSSEPKDKKNYKNRLTRFLIELSLLIKFVNRPQV